MKKTLDPKERETLLDTLKARFEKHMNRHEGVKWDTVLKRLEAKPEKLLSLHEMELSGGEPDLVQLDSKGQELLFMDCAPESPKGRRSLCYDREAWESRKEAKPKGSAQEMAQEMGVEMLSEMQYRQLQEFGEFDLKTSSWIDTPATIRKLGGSLFCDRRFDTVFTYHNGAESYYAARGFRALLRV